MKKLLFSLAITSTIFLTSCLNGFVYIAGNDNNKLFYDIFAVNAKLDIPTSMAVDEKTGDLYVVDQKYTVIKKITLDGKVSTFFDLNKSDITEENINGNFGIGIGKIKIKDDYLYFSTNLLINRIKLNSKEKAETYIGSGKANKTFISDVNSTEYYINVKEEKNFKDISFYQIVDFYFDFEGNLLIIDNEFLKLANTKTKILANVGLKDSRGFIKYETSGISKIAFNPISKEIYLISDHNNFHKISKILYQIDEDKGLNPSKKSNVTRAIGDFDFDSKGNIYLISIDNYNLLKFDLKDNVSIISNFWGVADIYKNSKGNLISDSMNIQIDRKRNILYLSVYEQNKIFKINL